MRKYPGNNGIMVNYTEVGSLDLSSLSEDMVVDIFLNVDKDETFMTSLYVKDGELVHVQNYVSPLEFATVEMKQVLTIYTKRKVISLDPDYYTKDDPKLHGFVSKLSYEGIKYVAEHVEVFAKAFKENKVSELLNIPKPQNKKYRS